jgi:SMC interacting uncharacterized protein involved in chromosome segregation
MFDQPEERPDVQKELDRRQEEILRLRDLLIVRDKELGTAQGRVAELEHFSRHLTNLVARISRVPGAMGAIRAALRRLRDLRRRSGV